MLLLGLDLEVGGAFALPHSEQFITEVGMVLWDTEMNMPVDLFSSLVFNGYPIAEEATEYTGITTGVCEKYGRNREYIKDSVRTYFAKADYIVAHNGNRFDRPVLEGWMGPYKYDKEKVWIDTMEDVDYPKNCRNRNLTYLAGFHLLLNCFPHRAVTDALTMMSVLAKYDIHQVIANATADKIIICAQVSFESKNLAKERGFFWQECDGKVFEKRWVKKIKKKDLEALSREYPFSVLVLEDLSNGRE